MGFAGSADIFQAEMGNLMAILEYIRAYIDNLLAISKGSLDDHLDKLKQVFIRLRNSGLKIKATKLFFCMQETEYLGYNLTTSEVALCPLLPWYCVKSSWKDDLGIISTFPTWRR